MVNVTSSRYFLSLFKSTNKVYQNMCGTFGEMVNGTVYILSVDHLENIVKDMNNINCFSTEALHNLVGWIYTYETKEIFIDVGVLGACGE